MRRILVVAALLVSVRTADASSGDASAFPGWMLEGEDGQRFAAAVDDKVRLDRKPSARLSTNDTDAKFGTLMQIIDAVSYRGKRVRLIATAKTEAVKGWTGIWLRIDAAEKKVLGFENTENHALRGDNNWTALEIVLDVPEPATKIEFGLSQDGPGSSWFGGIDFQAVDKGVALTKKGSKDSLRNGDFEASGLGDWFASGGGRRDYAATVVRDVKHGGKQAVKLTLGPGGDATKWFNVMQYIDPRTYAGKRVRASMWLRSEGVTKRGSFWARCDGADSDGKWPGLAGGWAKVEPTGNWQQHTMVFDVPIQTTQVLFGIELNGPGVLWADDAVFEIVPRDTPLQSGAPTTPRNLDFSDKR